VASSRKKDKNRTKKITQQKRIGFNKKLYIEILFHNQPDRLLFLFFFVRFNELQQLSNQMANASYTSIFKAPQGTNGEYYK